MKKILLAVLVSVCMIHVNAQFSYDYLKGADQYFEKGDYASAAEYYEKYLNKDSAGRGEFNPYTPQRPVIKKAPGISNQERAQYNLAESYRLLNYPSKAEPHYVRAMEMNKTRFTVAQYHLGTVQRALGKYPDAEQNLKSFLAGYSTEDNYTKMAKRELQNLEYIQAQLKKKDLKYYTVRKAPADLNSTGGNYAPVWVNSNTLLFTSTRPDDTLPVNTKTEKMKVYTNKVYQAVYTGGELTGIDRTELPQGKGVEQGVVSVTPDGKTMFLTRWTVNKNTRSSSLYKSTQTEKGWSDPVKLDESVNVPGYNSQQPFVTPDGKYLLYASDRTGGQGGFDIWAAELTDGTPGTSTNLGTSINTEYNEQAPFYHASLGSLIFSTDGRIGMGGYDFFQSKGTIGNWQLPENLGYPTNSVKDDIYFTSKSAGKNLLEDVLLSSDRDAACCLELFYLNKLKPKKEISGQVVSCDPKKPFKGGTVTIIDTVTNKVLLTTKVGPDGRYSITLDEYQPLTVKATAEGFFNNSLRFNAPSDPEADSLTNAALCMNPVPEVNETFVVNNVYYDFDKADLKPESYPALDEIVRMLEANPTMTIEIGAHTDSKGSDNYNQKLSEARAKSVVDYLLSQKVDPSRLTSKGYGEAIPIAPNTDEKGKDNPEGREKNRRTEFKVLKKD